jgi:DNA-binding response OmpR family regulator
MAGMDCARLLIWEERPMQSPLSTGGRPPDVDAAGPRVVILDDDPDILEILGSVLEDEGYRVDGCQKAEEALVYVGREPTDLVILDIRFEGWDRGWEILEALKRGHRTRDVAVLVCSSRLRALRDHALLMNFYGVRAIMKPFDLDEVIGAVRGAIRRRASPARS